jgi:hypothetical protein
MLRFGVAAAAVVVLAGVSRAEDPAPQAARSVHLQYRAPASVLFYNEATVEQSRPGTYFCACGFSSGYFGIQELGPGRGKVVIFSIWDPGDQNDPNAVAAEKRVELLHKGEGVRTGRFGGEGTGGQSFFDYDWKVGETYRFLVRSAIEGDKTTYTGYFYLNDARRWQEIASFRTLNKGAGLKGYYSFVEDFRRDGKSAREVHQARFGNGWVKTAAGEWLPLTRAQFTADRTTLTNNIDAGPEGAGFRLVTGGDTPNKTPLNTIMERTPVGVELPPM